MKYFLVLLSFCSVMGSQAVSYTHLDVYKRQQVSCSPLIIINLMEYSKLVAVTGLPGLFELINSKTDGAIVRSLEDKSTRFVSSRVHNFSHLESIEVYTLSLIHI